MCSHCVSNYHQRPENMSTEEWLNQFKILHLNQFSSLKIDNGSDSPTKRLSTITEEI
jgi:hypothetical protein